MAARTKARKRALDLLFESEARGLSLDGTLADRLAAQDPPVGDYSARLVRGVAQEQAYVDGLIGQHAHGWTLDRMPAVDRNLLRVAAYEIVFVDEVPDHVAVSEAVELAADLSTEESPAFVNGVLAAVVREHGSAGRLPS